MVSIAVMIRAATFADIAVMPATAMALAMVRDVLSEWPSSHLIRCLLARVAQVKVRMTCAERERGFDSDLGRLCGVVVGVVREA